MAKSLKWCCGGCLVLGVLAGIALLLGWRWAKSKPTSWTSEATIEIVAPPETVLALVEELPRWSEWSRLERDRRSSIQREFAGPARGVGASVVWTQPNATLGTQQTVGKLELTAAGPEGIEYQSWHYGKLRFAGFHEPGGVATTTHIEFGGFDEDYEVPGSIRIEPTPQGCRVIWSEAVDLGESIPARIFAATAGAVARFAHETLLEQSLEGLKNLSELR
jgi:hypothetical protein